MSGSTFVFSKRKTSIIRPLFNLNTENKKKLRRNINLKKHIVELKTVTILKMGTMCGYLGSHCIMIEV